MIAFFTELSLLWRLIVVFSLATAIGGAYGLWHHAVYKSGEDACQARYVAANIKGEQDHAKIKQKIMALPDADLNKRLERFMRD